MKASLKERIKERFQQLFELKNMNVPKLTERLGQKDPSYVYRVVNGIQNPTIEVLERFVVACGSNLGEFFAPWLAEISPATKEEEDAEVMAKLKRFLDDPMSRTGTIDAVLSWGDQPQPRNKSVRRKK